MVYRLNRTLLYGAAIVMLFFATGFFWSGVFRRRVLGPVLLLAMLLVTFIPSGIEFYELVSVSIMVLLIGMNILSIVLAMFKNTDDEEKSFCFFWCWCDIDSDFAYTYVACNNYSGSDYGPVNTRHNPVVYVLVPSNQ